MLRHDADNNTLISKMKKMLDYLEKQEEELKAPGKQQEEGVETPSKMIKIEDKEATKMRSMQRRKIQPLTA